MEAKGEVLTRRVLHFGSLNNVMATVFGKKYDFEKAREGLELEGLVSEVRVQNQNLKEKSM
ncbi:hypothetical protein PVK06_037691 [Gossypium arboreum]|uniref:Uncharacterized protein n=1 Tax=Gossypium arboreum TaxID=29729 RepID=A0ABR0MY22_GOSAR|nr:hypothetical protein PVK06_037691 [Gossypium arboreum]